MSWLSKLVGGKTLKIAALAGAGYFGSRYLFGAGQYGTLSDPAGMAYNPDTFAGKVFNKFNITPFQDTSFGQSTLGKAITETGSFLGIGQSSDAQAAIGAVQSLSAAQRFDRQISPGTITASGIRTDTNFQPGQIGRIPIGNGSQVSSALQSQAMQQYLAKQVRMMGLPAASRLPTASPVSTGALAQSTSAKRRQYKGLTSA
jgi:hypothetical protein